MNSVLESHIAKARVLKEELTRLKEEADAQLQKKENMTKELQKAQDEKEHDSQSKCWTLFYPDQWLSKLILLLLYIDGGKGWQNINLDDRVLFGCQII